MKKNKLKLIVSGVILIALASTVVGLNIRQKNIEHNKLISAEKIKEEKYKKLTVDNNTENSGNTSKEIKKEDKLDENKLDESSQKSDNISENKASLESENSNNTSSADNVSKPTDTPSTSNVNNTPEQVDKIGNAKKAAANYIGSKDVGVYFIDLKNGKSFGINENKIYYSASTGKLPGILYTQKKLKDGTINANTEFQYHDYVNNISGAMIRGGTGVLQNNVQEGEVVNVGTLLKYTCSYSDNLASNMLGYYVCDKNDGAFKVYISNIVSRNIGTFAKEFSAKETALLMKSINGEGGQAISDLQNTSWDKVKIPKYLPVKVAHKIGINGAYNHDVAVVYGNSPYVISIMTNGSSDEFIAQLSKKIYDELQ